MTHDTTATLIGEVHELRTENEALRAAVNDTLATPHRWCTKGQWTDTFGYLKCNCGKDGRDVRLREALA